VVHVGRGYASLCPLLRPGRSLHARHILVATPCEHSSFVWAVGPVGVPHTARPSPQTLLLVLLLKPLAQSVRPNAPATTNAHRGQLAAADEVVEETAGDAGKFGRLLDSQEPGLSAPSRTVSGLGVFWHVILAAYTTSNRVERISTAATFASTFSITSVSNLVKIAGLRR
jgi:hypothetical protein